MVAEFVRYVVPAWSHRESQAPIGVIGAAYELLDGDKLDAAVRGDVFRAHGCVSIVPAVTSALQRYLTSRSFRCKVATLRLGVNGTLNPLVEGSSPSALTKQTRIGHVYSVPSAQKHRSLPQGSTT
jgi:hypothetical protein